VVRRTAEREDSMAQRTVVRLVDDVDGSDADETVTYGIDGAVYEIDLNRENAGDLRDALAPYISVSRAVGRLSGAAVSPARRGR